MFVCVFVQSEVQDSSGSILHSMAQIVFGRQDEQLGMLGEWFLRSWSPSMSIYLIDISDILVVFRKLM